MALPRGGHTNFPALNNPESLHTSYIICMHQVIVKATDIHKHMHEIIFNIKRAMNLKKSEERYMAVFGRREKGKDVIKLRYQN